MKRVQEHHTEISPQKFGMDGMEKICLNVGGQRHETYLSTVGHLPDTRLYWIIESVVKSPDFDPETTEIFFDRHPGVFAQILNYYRTGKLHCPTDVCGPLFEQELSYWGIDEKDMEPCCWANYTQHRDAEENLKNVLYEGTSDDPIVDHSPGSQPSELTRLWRKLQPRVWAILDESRSSNRAKVFSFTSVLFIVLSVAVFCMNTVPELSSDTRWQNTFKVVETICGVWFTLEFVLRTVFCPDKWAFARNWTTWLDFVAVMPFYLKLMISGHRKTINALLVIRLLRLFRFFRLIYGLQVLSHTLKASSYELILLLSMLLIPVILFSSIVFFIEDHLDRENTLFRSIPHSFWWSLITITTVGYGDMHPVSWLGKIVGCMCAICGVLIVALPVSIIGSNFTLFYTHAQARLKLPKKKNRVFLQQTSSVYSERKSARRRAIRRKISSRASDCYSVAYEDSRPCSVQGPSPFQNGFSSTKSVASRNSSLGNEDGRSGSSTINLRKPGKKKVSTISVKIPMHELSPDRRSSVKPDRNSETFLGVAQPSPPQRGYSSFDSVHVITRRSPLRDSSRANSRNSGNVELPSVDYSLNKDKRNVRFTSASSSPEIAPLLLTVKTPEGDNNAPELSEIRIADDKQNCGGYLQGPVDRADWSDSQAESNSDSEKDVSLSEISRGRSFNPILTTRRKNAIVSWTRRNSALPRIKETCANSTQNTFSETTGDGAPEKDTVFMNDIQFNRRRRQSVF